MFKHYYIGLLFSVFALLRDHYHEIIYRYVSYEIKKGVVLNTDIETILFRDAWVKIDGIMLP